MSEDKKQENGSEENAETNKLSFLESFKARSNDQRYQSSHNIYAEFVVSWRAMGKLRDEIDGMSGQAGESAEHISVDRIDELKEELERNSKALGIAQGKIKDLEESIKRLKK